MKSDKWLVLCVEEILDDLRDSSVFSTLDLFQVYRQIKISETCKEKTTFISKFGTYQFQVMLLGLKNLGATFQRMMSNILVNVRNIKYYVDDVVIHSVTEERHIKHLENVFALLLKHGLRIRLKKCSFMQPVWNCWDFASTKIVSLPTKEIYTLYVVLIHRGHENS